MQIPYVNLAAQHKAIKDEILMAVGTVLDHGQFIMGEELGQFEQRLADLCGVRFAVGVNSGSDALIFALQALGIGPGDEVITVPNSFVSSTSCIALVGARPIFVDVGDDYNMDPAQLERVITHRTKAILPVHLTGRPADMDPILNVAKKHGLFVIEDCAQAVAAEYRGQRVGSFGTTGCFSFHPLKTLNACGDGGVVTTRDESLNQRLRVLRNLGLSNRDECVAWSHNSRLDTLQAAILMVKLNYLEEWTEKRRANARFYQEALAEVGNLRVPVDRAYEKAVYHTFVIEADRRDALRDFLASKGIGTAVHYPIAIHLQQVAAELAYRPGSFPVAEKQATRILSLPVYPELKRNQLEYVASCIQDFYRTR